MIPMNLFMKQKESHRLQEQTYGCHGAKIGESIVREFGGEWIHVYICLNLFAVYL